MIIYSDMTYQSCSAFPDTLYDENALYVLPDNSELANKFLEYSDKGYIPKLVFDDSGNIVDIGYDDTNLQHLEIENEIYALKEELSSGDYKVIKCYEASLTGNPLPYDIEQLKEERDSIRNHINELEELL